MVRTPQNGYHQSTHFKNILKHFVFNIQTQPKRPCTNSKRREKRNRKVFIVIFPRGKFIILVPFFIQKEFLQSLIPIRKLTSESFVEIFVPTSVKLTMCPINKCTLKLALFDWVWGWRQLGPCSTYLLIRFNMATFRTFWWAEVGWNQNFSMSFLFCPNFCFSFQICCSLLRSLTFFFFFLILLDLQLLSSNHLLLCLS